MTIKLIVAVDQGNSIGFSNGTLPWKIAPDMQRFKNLTMGHDVLMGRTTYQSLNRPNGLPNRRNIVLTRRPYSEVRGQFGEVDIISSFDWVRAHQACLGCEPPDLWVIGGAQVYKEALDLKLVDELYVTLVHTISGGDVTFPYDLYGWKLFVLRQRKIGVNWDLVSTETPPVPPNCPAITFMNFRRIPE